MIYLFVGQPGSGKTTMAKMLKDYLGEDTFHIDGDDMRILFPNTDYSKEGRIKNIQKSFDIAKYLNAKSKTVVISMVAPYRELREILKSDCEVTEVYLYTTKERGRESFFVDNFEKPLIQYNSVCTDGNPTETFEQIKKVLYL